VAKVAVKTLIWPVSEFVTVPEAENDTVVPAPVLTKLNGEPEGVQPCPTAGSAAQGALPNRPGLILVSLNSALGMEFTEGKSITDTAPGLSPFRLLNKTPTPLDP
jgi:hypothetical protein